MPRFAIGLARQRLYEDRWNWLATRVVILELTKKKMGSS